MTAAQVDFGNWIRPQRCLLIGSIGLMLILGAIAVSGLLRVLLLGTGLVMTFTALFILYLYWLFSSSGGDIQRKLWQLTVQHLQLKTGDSVLDIGTGNGALAILLAQQNTSVTVTGIDLWQADWNYSCAACEQNALLAGVNSQVSFEPGSAAQLQYPDESFDAVTSHFVFHEVRARQDKREVITEALRVLKPGGSFAFHDMFFDEHFYGKPEALQAWLQSCNLCSANLVTTGSLLKIPGVLTGKRALGCSGLLWGKK